MGIYGGVLKRPEDTDPSQAETKGLPSNPR